MDYFSLPVLASRPSLGVLANTLENIEITQFHDFERTASLDISTHQWLTSLVGNDLTWLPEETADLLRERAARRLAQASGAVARASSTRRIHLQKFTVDLYEPGITEENIGHITWGSALVLSKRIENNPTLLKGRVIELGSGTGLCGIVAAKLGCKVLLTDLPEIVPNILTNISRNADIDADLAILDWSQPESFKKEHFYDTIIVSDPVYSAGQSKLLVNTIMYIGAPRVLLEIPIRRGWESERLAVDKLMEASGYLRELYEEEEATDEFGNSRFAFSLWVNDI